MNYPVFPIRLFPLPSFFCLIALLAQFVWTVQPAFAAPGDYYRLGTFDREFGELKKVTLLITVDEGGGSLIPPQSWAEQNENNQRMDTNLRADSYGQAWLNWTIYPGPGEDPLVVDGASRMPLSHGDQHVLTSTARNLAVARWGHEIEFGMRLRYGVFGTGPDGSAYVGGNQAAGTGDMSDQYHEITHNFGHHHGSDQTTPVGGGGGGYSAPMRALNGWLREAEGFHRVTQSGIYRIYDLNNPTLMPGRQLAAVVERTHPDETYQGMDLWVEYRPQLTEIEFRDQDGDKALFPEFREGVRLVNYRSRYSVNIDIDPDDGRRFSMLLPGESWTDDTNLKIIGESYTPNHFTVTTLRVNDTVPASVDVRIDIPGSNDYLPQAGADVPRLMATGIAETFDGTLSLDHDGSITSYDWDFGDGNSSSEASPSHSYASPGTYTWTLTVTDNNGHTSTEYGEVEVVAAAAPAFTLQPVGLSEIEGNDVTFEVEFTGAPIPTLQWYKGADPLPGETGKTLTLTGITLGDAGDYSAVIVNAIDTVTSDTATLTVIANSPPVAAFTSLATGNTAPMALTLNASASFDTDDNPLSYFWDIGDGNGFVPGTVSQSVTLNEAGFHTVRLKVNDGLVDSPVAEQQIWVSSDNPGAAVTPVGSAHVEKGTFLSGHSYTRTLAASENTVLLLGATHTWSSDEVTGVTVDGSPMTLLARETGFNPGATTIWGIELGTVTEGQTVTIQMTANLGNSPQTALGSVQLANASLTGTIAGTDRAGGTGPTTVEFPGGLAPGSYLFAMGGYNRDGSSQTLNGIPTLASGIVDGNKVMYVVGGEQVTGASPASYTLSYSASGGKSKGIALAAVAVTPQLVTRSIAYNSWLETVYPSASGDEQQPTHIPHPVNGLSNLQYFAYGIDNPLASTPDPVQAGIVDAFGTRLQLQFPRHTGRPDITYEVYASNDLIEWDLIARSVNGQETENVGGQTYTIDESGSGDIKTVTVQDLISSDESPKRFIRLELSMP